jgi:hypothetical protein
MNERIKELWTQAGGHYNSGNQHTWPEYTIDDPEKFAELIVRECLSIVDEQKECLHEEQQYWHDRDYGYALAVDDASKGIKQFFGVEE